MNLPRAHHLLAKHAAAGLVSPAFPTGPRHIIGHGKRGPIFAVAGGDGSNDDDAGDSDDGDADDTDDAGDDDKDTPGGKPAGDKPKPAGDDGKGGDDDAKTPSKDAERELRETRTALKKANAEAKAARLAAEKLRKQNETENEKAIREAKEAGAAEAAGKYKSVAVRQAAKAALREAGLNGTDGPMLRLVDPEKVDIGDDGEITGLEDQVAAIKADFPERFKTEQKPKPGGKADAGGKKPAPTKPKSSAERIAASVLAGD